MFDFLMVSERSPKKGVREIYPKFIVRKSKDLMIRGNAFYAIWNDDDKLWSTDEDDAIMMIDRELDLYFDKVKDNTEDHVKVMHLWDSDSGMIDKWNKYCQKQMRNNYHQLDDKIIFANTATKKTDYASKKLEYSLKEGSIDAYEELISTLYSPEERKKIEWAIGAIISGDSKTIQKFMVLYGSAGTGKSTILNIIQELFDGYYSSFNAKALGSLSSSFALEAFRTNPLVAIQHDGDLSRIEDNTRLNSIVSHEVMTVNEKFKSSYDAKFNCFLFMGTNKPVRITDAKSGIIRRLIDVSPTGKKIPESRYNELIEQVKFELGAIAWHCLQVYRKNKRIYSSYIPEKMIVASNDFYNFVLEYYEEFEAEDGITLKAAYEKYNRYCESAKVSYPYNRRAFQEELKNYFKSYDERMTLEDGTRVWKYYSGFIKEKFSYNSEKKTSENENEKKSWLEFLEQPSIFDEVERDSPAQYAVEDGSRPKVSWDKCKTTLKDIDTKRIHFMRPFSPYHIIVDFDLKDEHGNKSFDLNYEAAKKFKPTYAELSKSGGGIHLHYIYTGNPEDLESLYSEGIEIKVFTGKMSLRRKLTKCNNLPIATIDSGLPVKKKEVKKAFNQKQVKTESKLEELIFRNLNKEFHDSTKQSINFIKKILDEAHNSDLVYDVSHLRNDIMDFAMNSTHNKAYCHDVVNQMQFKSRKEPEEKELSKEKPIIFADCEVYPNLFVIVWKELGADKPFEVMLNPSQKDVVKFLNAGYRMIGHNCRKYDNHIFHARALGYSLQMLFRQSLKIINNEPDAYFREAYNYSYTDTLDYASNKMSLKKWEIKLHIHHKEMGLPWDQPVPEELWPQVVEYCKNDVAATEAVFNATQGDFIAREILADIAGGIVNDTTNKLTTKLIFGNDKDPQKQFNYRFLGDDPRFSGYEFKWNPKIKKFESLYRGEIVGEGGFVYAVPGMYRNVVTFDVASMHPSSIIAENLFGDKYTKIFKQLVEARVAIKHGDFETAGKMFDGKLKKYLTDKKTAKSLANALKIAINSVYGLTAAKFDNSFRDPRNKDNIVAKRGALFMVNLRDELVKRGAQVIHIKTDSIKIVNPSDDISKFVIEYGKEYGYNFEIEHKFEKICLVNDAVYIAKCAKDDPETPGEWTATGTQFAVPYVFKKLFSKEEIDFYDLCETKSVTTALYLDMNEDLPDVSLYEKELSKCETKLRKLKKDFGDDVCWNDMDRGHLYTDSELEEIGDEKLVEIVNLFKERNKINKLIEPGHNYIFVGRVGLFTPILHGAGGGWLVREKDGKYYSVGGTKGYRWLESELVENLKKHDDIDISYYDKLLKDAVKSINEQGVQEHSMIKSFEEFVA